MFKIFIFQVGPLQRFWPKSGKMRNNGIKIYQKACFLVTFIKNYWFALINAKTMLLFKNFNFPGETASTFWHKNHNLGSKFHKKTCFLSFQLQTIFLFGYVHSKKGIYILKIVTKITENVHMMIGSPNRDNTIQICLIMSSDK